MLHFVPRGVFPPGDIPEDGTAGMLPAQGTISMYEIGIAGQDRAGANTRMAPPWPPGKSAPKTGAAGVLLPAGPGKRLQMSTLAKR